VLLFVALVALIGAPVRAAMVAELQMPAWLEREGQQQALTAGTGLQELDIIETGEDGRLAVLLRDGTVLRLGSRSRLSIHELRESLDKPALLRATFSIPQGSLRLSTASPALPVARDITVELGNTMASVQQADLCANVTAEAEVICLIAGSLTVTHPSSGSFLMDQPHTVFRAPKAGNPGPITPADPEMLQAWIAATQPVLPGGLTIPDGGWIVQLASQVEERGAQQLARRLQQAGYAAEVTTSEIGGRRHYRVRITRFDSKAGARAFADQMQGQLGVKNTWVTCPAAGCEKQ
jgi:cell division septation protein DedD